VVEVHVRVVARHRQDQPPESGSKERPLSAIRTTALRRSQWQQRVEPCHWHLATLGQELPSDPLPHCGHWGLLTGALE